MSKAPYARNSATSKAVLTVSWFSAGVSSAVATALDIDRIDRILYIHIEDQHEDTLRFVHDCEAWFGIPTETIQSPLKSVENACRMAAFVNSGRLGAACTERLKRRLRKQWESEQTKHLRYVWGFDCHEVERADRITHSMPNQDHLFPLIEQKINKAQAHAILKANSIRRPAMYDLGYQNNNCIGCVKGGMGYWNKIRVDFPAVFAARAKMERDIGGTCINGIYLDGLDPERGRNEPPICDECGIMCELMRIP